MGRPPSRGKKFAVTVHVITRSAPSGAISTGSSPLAAARSSNARVAVRQVSYARSGEVPLRDRMSSSRSAPGNRSDRSSTPSTTLNTAVLAPMPSASVTTAASVKPGLRASVRSAYRRSLMSQRDHGVHLRRSARREIARQQRDRDEQQGGEGKAPGVQGTDPGQAAA